MNQEEREKKHEILNKIAELVKVASALGDATEDQQTQFIAETFKLVLMSGSDPETAKLFSDHIINYLNELEMRKGVKKVSDHFKNDVPLCLN
jgi:hypothetical protein